MQADKYNYKPDEQFTNRGWEEMQKKLDKEMPVEKKKRRGLLWFSLLGVLLMVSGIGFFSYKKSQTNTSEKDQKVYAKTKKLQNQNFNQNQNIQDENNLTINNSKNEVVDLREDVKKNQKTNSIKSAKSNFHNNINTNNFIQNSEKDNLNITSKNNSVVILEEPYLESKKLDDKVFEKENTVASRESMRLSSIDFLEVYLKEKERRILTIDEDDLEVGKAEIVKYIPQKKRKVNLGLNAGALLDMENNQKLGAFISAQIQFPFGEKLGIRSGLGYALINKNLNYQFSDIQNANYFDPTSMTSGGFDPTQSFNNIAVNTQTLFILEKLHYLEIPLLLTYQPNKNWQFQVGVNGSFLIKDDLTLIESSYGFSDESEAENLGIELANVYPETVDLEQFRKQDYWKEWNMNAVFGMAFKINSHWKIEIQYHRSFSKFLETNEDGVFADQLQLPDNLLIPNQAHSNSGAYYVQNEALGSPLALDYSSDLKDLNINHSLRLAVGFTF